MKVRADSEKRAAVLVRPKDDEESVPEIGYMYSMRDEVFLRDDNRVNLVWFIKVPATGNRYSCSYMNRVSPTSGSVTTVRIVRPKEVASDAGDGYVIGLHGKISGKSALVWVIDEEELEMDAEREGLQE